ncbi:hypothetical protein DS745_21140 [Anaerobacillus alkaliphilus]|uniref:Uncharacterized protein n=1 Tax=Anaerobacillus alkaliphilus TaxID=1548597 RepID=A0A4Q0VLA8_9BACI|nr:DUF5696 domain-containing protein [Anaerobacillus alkaliphilus]RXI96247.1 hypothetical protein DS745_21140 [Anaerobacillus alkaliphilus]
MRIVKTKTAVKLVLFIAIVASLFTFVFMSEDSEISVNIPNTPSIPEPTDTSKEEKPEDQPAPAPEPEQVGLEDDGLENRVSTIASRQAAIDGHKYLTENEKIEMYVKEENLSIVIRDKNTGAVMYSTIEKPVQSNEAWTNFMKSSIVMEYLVGTNIVTYRADMYSNNPKKEITYKEDGFHAKVTYPELEITFELNVSLTDSGLVTEIPKDKIQENNERYKVSGFYVYPFLGYSKLGEREGYMFIPDGSGALIHLKDNDGKFRQPYSEMVYGNNVGIDDPLVLSLFNGMNPFNNPEKILAPVFGMVQTDTNIGFLGIIEEGQYSAKIEAYPSGAILPYNWVTSKFIYRQVYNQPTSQQSGTMVVRQRNMNDFNIRVRYEFLSQEKATYFGLAERYRNYLLDNQLIMKREDDFKVRVDMFGADVENGLISKKNVTMTTFGQASQIFNDLQSKGIDQILSIYKGWQNKGYFAGLPFRSFKPESALNDDKSLLDLIDESKEQNIDLFLYHDALRINLAENRNPTYKVMRKFNKRQYSEDVYGKVYKSFHYLQPKSSVDTLERMQKQYSNHGVDQLLIAGISNQLFSFSDSNKEYDRITTKGYYEEIISNYDQQFDLLLEQPFSYLWKYTNAMIDLPASSSGYVFTDEDIPFIALTLKGIVPMYSEYVNFQANQVEFFLKLVEQGINPSFLLTHEDPAALLNTNSSSIYSSKYERYEDVIEQYYFDLKEIHETTKNSVIVNFQRSNGITTVTYDNGTTIYVNYQDRDVKVAGQTIQALSYKVVRGR